MSSNMTIDGILVTDLWQTVDNSLAPLSAKQLQLIDKLENLCSDAIDEDSDHFDLEVKNDHKFIDWS